MVRGVWAIKSSNSTTPDQTGFRQILHFEARDIRFCIDIRHILRVVPLVALQSVPAAPEYVKGLLNLAGDSIPVLDLPQRLGLENPKEYSLNVPIILCTDGQNKAGLIVTKTLDVSVISESQIRMASSFRDGNSPFLGVVNKDHQQSLLLDLPRVLAIELGIESIENWIDPAIIPQQARLT